MTARAAQILREALALPAEERADVAAELLASLDEPADQDVDVAWATELERRARRVLSGESQGTEWSEVRARIVSRVLER
jgi:putative addiction module component (TIGR02574 family)